MSGEPISELERVREASLERLRGGRLPIGAERRLRALRGRADFFTSGLSVSEFALGRELGLSPISQVMGSCVYHVAWPTGQSLYGWEPGKVYDVPIVSEAWNQARTIALRRLQLEGAECGAVAVVGVELRRSAKELAPESVEFTAFGTAVGRPGVKPPRLPALTNLSGQDYWLLVSNGFAPVGVAADTRVVACVPDAQSQRAQRHRRLVTAGRASRELEAFGRGIQRATRAAVEGMRVAAEGRRPDGIVGVRVEREAVTVKGENADLRGGVPLSREDLVVTVHVVGTAIARNRGSRRLESLSITPIRNLRLKGETIA